MFGRNQSSLREIKKLSLIAVSHPRLGHAASRVDKTNCWEKYAGSLSRFGASPHQRFEDEDDDEDEYDVHARASS